MSEYFYPLDGRKHYKDLEKAQKDMFQAFKNFNNEIFEKESALSRKMKELIAIGVAHTTQCPYCIEGHVRAAKKAGASDQEIAEAIFVAAALRAGGAFAHSTIAMSVLNEMDGGKRIEITAKETNLIVRNALMRDIPFQRQCIRFRADDPPKPWKGSYGDHGLNVGREQKWVISQGEEGGCFNEISGVLLQESNRDGDRGSKDH